MKKIKFKIVMLLALSLVASVVLLNTTTINAASDPADAPADWAFEASSVELNDAIVAKYPSLNNGNGFVTVSAANAMSGRLQVSGSNIAGTINGIENFTSITELYLYINQLSGEIPSGLGNLNNLKDLNLGSNRLEGEIPSSLGNLSNLKTLYLYGNKLGGEIPSSLGNLNNLTHLELSSNQLSGEIPSSLGGLSKLTSLDLVRNQLSGEIPTSMGNLSNVVSMNLNQNQLSGEIPSSLGNLSNLTSLNLQNNQLSGEIPSSFSGLNSIILLSVNDNQLTSVTQSTYNFLESLTYYSASNQTNTDNILMTGTVNESFEFSGLPAYEQFPNYGITFEYNLTLPDGTMTTVTPIIVNGKVLIAASDLSQVGDYMLVATGTSTNTYFTNMVYTTNFNIKEATLVTPVKPIIPVNPVSPVDKKPNGIQGNNTNVLAPSVATGDNNSSSTMIMLISGLLISGTYLAVRKRIIK